MKLSSPFILIAFIVVAFESRTLADWPQFLGLHRNGISDEKNLARSWPQEGLKILWQVEIGPGYGGASVRDDQVYFYDRQDDERDVLRCFDLNTGKELWQCASDMPGRLTFNGSRCTPTVDQKHVYYVGTFGNVYCVDRLTHQITWRIDLKETFQSSPPPHGYTHAPLVYKNSVIVCPVSTDAGLVALDKLTGKPIWSSVLVGEFSYSTPLLVTISGVRGILFVSRTGDLLPNQFPIGQVSFIDPDNGRMLWKYQGFYGTPIPIPLVIGEDRIFITGEVTFGSVMISVRKQEDGFVTSDLFRLPKNGSKVQPALFYNDYIYANFNADEKPKTPDGLVCLDLEGKIIWQSGKTSPSGMGNFIIADGMIFILGGDSGELALVQAAPQGYQELARTKVLSGKGNHVFAPLAISGGKLIVRDQHEMKCLDVRVREQDGGDDKP